MFAYSIGLSSNSYLKQDITQLSFELFYDSWPLQKGVHLIFLYCVCKKDCQKWPVFEHMDEKLDSVKSSYV